MGTAYLKRTPSSAGSNTTGTVSAWVKYTTNGDYNTIIGGNEGSSSTDRSLFAIAAGTDGAIYNQIVDGGTNYYQESTRRLRDPGAWYHIVYQFDTSNAVQADRIKTYVNNELIDDWQVTASWPSSVDIKLWDSAASAEYMIGCRKSSSSYQYFFNGTMAHVYVIDGTVYAPSTFAETDSTSGLWVPKTSVSVTYGTNGGFYKFQDSSNYGDDTSGQGNDMTMVGTITQTKDSPQNNFMTCNPLDNYYPDYTFDYGNTRINKVNAGPETFITHSVPMFTGKWYWETKVTAKGSNMNIQFGVSDRVPDGPSGGGYEGGQYLGYNQYSYGFNLNDGKVYDGNGSSSSSYGSAAAEGDIIGTYLDLDNSKLYFAINGTIQNSGTGISIQPVADTLNGYYLAATGTNSGATETKTFDHNFGNGYFGITAISGAVADTGGEGLFKYNPSTGTFDGSSKDFRAVCTNNIATYG
jgi:hypothetical protein